MSNKRSEKIALVTGSSTGIGLATAKRFANEGAHVFITGRRQAELDAAVKEIGKNLTAIQADSSRPADLDKVYAAIKAQTGRLDVLFANAGVAAFVPLAAVTEEHFDQLFSVNVKGTLFTVQKALPLLVDGASVILTSSTAGITGTEAFSVYSATKAAIGNFARSWILELKAGKIRVNVVSPGPTDTPGLAGLAPDAENAKGIKGYLAAQVPLGRVGDPDEVAKAAVFLAADDSSFVKGAEIVVDGGIGQV